MDKEQFKKHLVKHDSDENFKYGSGSGAGGRAAGGDGRRVAGTKPQRETAAVGAAESAQPEADARDCGGAGDAADTRAIAGTGASTTKRGDRGTGSHRRANRCVAGGNGAADSAPWIKLGNDRGAKGTGLSEVAGRAPTNHGELRGAVGGGILRIWLFQVRAVQRRGK
jgi:hypothetical protein